MLQNIINLFSVELFVTYLLLGIAFIAVLIKAYFFVLRGIAKGVLYGKFAIFMAIVSYGSMIAYMILTYIKYGLATITVTGTVMYIVMYFPIKYITKIVERRASEIVPNRYYKVSERI